MEELPRGGSQANAARTSATRATYSTSKLCTDCRWVKLIQLVGFHVKYKTYFFIHISFNFLVAPKVAAERGSVSETRRNPFRTTWRLNEAHVLTVFFTRTPHKAIFLSFCPFCKLNLNPANMAQVIPNSGHDDMIVCFPFLLQWSYKLVLLFT